MCATARHGNAHSKVWTRCFTLPRTKITSPIFPNSFTSTQSAPRCCTKSSSRRNCRFKRSSSQVHKPTYGEGKYECARDGVQYPPLRPLEQLQRREWEPRCPVCGGALTMRVTDEARVNPHNQYAMSKYTQEMIALNLGQRYHIPSVAMRYSIVQGPRQSFRNAYSGVLRIFTTRLLNDRAPICYEDGQQLRDYVSVHDVARANLLVLNDARADYRAFNVGGGRAISVIEYARLIARRMGKDIAPQIPGQFRFGDTRHIVSDISQLRALGWEPRVPFEEIVDEYIAWASAQPDVRDYYADAEREMLARGTLREAMSQ
jgi:dTDP-L-rhamnose 4-epimerase